ncbi:TPM domain-containing protein [Undibacterium sp. 5I1]|uniref:TPM domain-containing protein n=1 Tax=unclassified Undibacterium TaxID=2630295 RepID=UPI002AB35732|nr:MULTISPECIES: TPM domain-containing protein [unclassified Undibacterium]MDY7537852.1 TPM domain-containing protein [Undibacterium sp. 5I1]MEB0232308.1 TPM domain-containing protein [Undibacterium sp. 10I3]MEB0259123.1 TPM domain-containing protein [Undibacterium sp. 5I1]
MDFKRIAKHLMMTHWQVNSHFNQVLLSRIEKAIKQSEMAHVGEIRFVVEGALDGMLLFQGQTARERALDVFSHLRMWDTENNNGVLIYLLYADRDVEIIADRGIHSKVQAGQWSLICRQMETAFKNGNYENGAISGIHAVTLSLAEHFPAEDDVKNHLPDRPLIL